MYGRIRGLDRVLITRVVVPDYAGVDDEPDDAQSHHGPLSDLHRLVL